MVSIKSKSAIEFLHFLADISDPATGVISRIKLAAWLGMTEAELCKRWIRRGTNIAWPRYADELLSVLDAAHEQGYDLERVIDWYFHARIEQAGQRTADQIVTDGEAGWLARQLDTFGIWIHTTLGRNVPLSR